MNQSQRQRKLNQIPIKPDGKFWNNVNLLATVDLVAQRYGLLPTEVLELSMHDFMFNVTVLLAVLKEQSIEAEKAKMKKHAEPKGRSWASLGIHHEVK